MPETRVPGVRHDIRLDIRHRIQLRIGLGTVVRLDVVIRLYVIDRLVAVV